MQDLSSWIRDQTCVPAMEVWSLNHWTTGKSFFSLPSLCVPQLWEWNHHPTSDTQNRKFTYHDPAVPCSPPSSHSIWLYILSILLLPCFFTMLSSNSHISSSNFYSLQTDLSCSHAPSWARDDLFQIENSHCCLVEVFDKCPLPKSSVKNPASFTICPLMLTPCWMSLGLGWGLTWLLFSLQFSTSTDHFHSHGLSSSKQPRFAWIV